MQVNGYNKSQLSFQGNLPELYPKVGSAVGKLVKLGETELEAFQHDLNTTLIKRAKKETASVLDVFSGNGATVVRDEMMHNQRTIIAKNEEGKIASTSAKHLDLLA